LGASQGQGPYGEDVQARTSERSAAETPDHADFGGTTFDRNDVAAGLLHHRWIAVLAWAAVTIWLAGSLGS
jgi:hypothetical protein